MGAGNTEVGPGLDPIAVEESMEGFQHWDTPTDLLVCARKSLPATEPCHVLVAVRPQQPLRVGFTGYSSLNTFTHISRHLALPGLLGWTPFSTRFAAPRGKDHHTTMVSGCLVGC